MLCGVEVVKHAIIKNALDIEKVTTYLSMCVADNAVKMVTIAEPKNIRSLAINKLYWLWLAEMRDHILDVMGETYITDAIHEQMKQMFLQPTVYKFKSSTIVTYSSKKLSNKLFCEYLEKISFYCADRLDLILSQPVDIFYEAMGRK